MFASHHSSSEEFRSAIETGRKRGARAIIGKEEVAHSPDQASGNRLGLRSSRDDQEDAAIDKIIVELENAVCGLLETQSTKVLMGERYLARQAKRLRRMNLQCEKLLGRQFHNAPLNILLELFIREGRGEKTPVKHVCLAVSVAPSTALRWMTRLEELDLISRADDNEDARRCLVELTPKGRGGISRFLAVT